MTRQEIAATALANTRAWRRGVPIIKNVLEMLKGAFPHLYEEVMEDAAAMLKAIDADDATDSTDRERVG